jgi:hypothetical protein
VGVADYGGEAMPLFLSSGGKTDGPPQIITAVREAVVQVFHRERLHDLGEPSSLPPSGSL